MDSSTLVSDVPLRLFCRWLIAACGAFPGAYNLSAIRVHSWWCSCLAGVLPVSDGLLTTAIEAVQFSPLMVFSALPGAGSQATSYSLLLGSAFIRNSGSSFPWSEFCIAWFPREKQGAALGIYGLGNIGQSRRFIGPSGRKHRVGTCSAQCGRLRWSGLCSSGSPRRNAEVRQPKVIAAMLAVLGVNVWLWVLSAFYSELRRDCGFSIYCRVS